MECQYTEMAKVFKALSDPKRVKIVDLLSCGEMCACVLLKCFEISQPTLAHDMKVLTEADIVIGRREGKNMYYSLNWEKLRKMGKCLQLMWMAPKHAEKGRAQKNAIDVKNAESAENTPCC